MQDHYHRCFELNGPELGHVTHALAELLRRDCEAAVEDVGKHFGGSPVALEDARSSVRRGAEVAAVLDRLG